ncbi:MAG: hypothetical protein ACHQ4J_05570, partial [Candidatus Binatia bacterium]
MIVHRNSILSIVILGAWLGAAAAAHAACSTSICVGSSSACTISGSNTIDAGCTLDFGTKNVTVASGATLNGDNNGNNCYTIKANNLTLDGTLRAHSGCIIVTITGNFLSEINGSGVGTVDVSNVDDSDAAPEFELTASGSVTLNGTKIDATGASDNAGGDIAITGTTVTGASTLRADGGTGGGSGGSITVTTTTATNGAYNIYLTGTISADGTSPLNGGTISLDAMGGLTVGTSSKGLQARGFGGDFGGEIDLTARGGTATVNGALNVNGNGTDSYGFGAYGGTINVSGVNISTGALWTANG